MVGKYLVRVSNARQSVEFEVQRKFTILRGDSGTGKSLLFSMVWNKTHDVDKSIHIDSKVPLVAIQGNEPISTTRKCIVIIDELTLNMYKSKDNMKSFINRVRHAEAYFILISRYDFSAIPYSILEIYELLLESVIGKRKLHRYVFKRVYPWVEGTPMLPDCIVTEDGNSGYQFMCNSVSCDVVSARGKSNLSKKIKELEGAFKNIFVLADGAALGPEAKKLQELVQMSKTKINLYAPESFEFLILSSEIFKSQGLSSLLEKTYMYADAKKFMSWEQYYFDLLVRASKKFNYSDAIYSKTKLSSFYLSDANKRYILDTIKELLIC